MTVVKKAQKSVSQKENLNLKTIKTVTNELKLKKNNLEKNNLEKNEIVVDCLNPLSANLTTWSNTLQQFVGILPTNCFSVFDHFVKLALKGLKQLMKNS